MNKFLTRLFKKTLLLSFAIVALSLPFFQRILGVDSEKEKDTMNGIAVAHADVSGGDSGGGVNDAGCSCDVGSCGDC